MTVSSEQSRVQYASDGVATSFPVPFRFLRNRDLRVTLIHDQDGTTHELVLDSDYTLSGANQAAGGTLTTTTTLASGQTLIVERVMSITQETAYQRNDPFPERAHEQALDRLTMIAQQFESWLGTLPGAFPRVLHFPIEFPRRQSVLPSAHTRARKALIFDALGNVTVGKDDYEDQAANAAQSAAEAAASAASTKDDREAVEKISNSFGDLDSARDEWEEAVQTSQEAAANAHSDARRAETAANTSLGASSAVPYRTLAELQASPTPTGRVWAAVTNDPDDSNNGFYIWTGSQWRRSDMQWVSWEEIEPVTGNAIGVDSFNDIDRPGFYRDQYDGSAEGTPFRDGYAAVLHIEKFENRSHQLGFRSNPNNPRVGVRTKNTGPYGAWRYFVFEDIFHAAIDVLDSKIAAFPAITSRMSSRAPAFLDDFYRSEQRPTTLGLSSSVWRWHNSGSFQVRNGIAQLANSAVRNSRYYARTGFTFKSYISSCTVEVGETFNFGWTYRVPDDSTTSNPRLYCRIYLNASGANRIRLGYGTSGSNDADAETVFDGEIHALGNQSHEFTFVQDGPRVLAFVNGALVMDHTITPDQDALLGHSAGINALIYSNIDELKIRRVVAWRLHDKPAKTPQVMAHRMVVKGPFGPDTYTTDTRDPESCLSALERLPSGVGIETDIRQSSDRHYILMHDPTVDRTTYGTGEVSAMTLAELTALKIRGLGGRNVPSLAELLRALEDRPDIPLAFLQLYGPNIADAIAEINQASPGVKARCVLFVNNLGQAQGARNVDADIRLAVGGRNNANESEIPDLVAARVEIGVISPGDTSYAANRGQVAKLHAAGIKVFASTTQMHYTMRQIAADGTDGYLSDYPTGSAA